MARFSLGPGQVGVRLSIKWDGFSARNPGLNYICTLVAEAARTTPSTLWFHQHVLLQLQ